MLLFPHFSHEALPDSVTNSIDHKTGRVGLRLAADQAKIRMTAATERYGVMSVVHFDPPPLGFMAASCMDHCLAHALLLAATGAEIQMQSSTIPSS